MRGVSDIDWETPTGRIIVRELARLYPKKQFCDGLAACFMPRRVAPALPISAITTTNSATTLRIIAAGIIRPVAGSDHLTYLVESIQNADDHVSLAFN